MSLIYAGGWVMVPLFLVSVLVLAIAIEKILVFQWHPMPKNLSKNKEINNYKDIDSIALTLCEVPWLSRFGKALRNYESATTIYENYLILSLETIRSFLEKRLQLLLTLAKISPMLGLLGTVIGMIQSFSVVSQSTSGVDMELLAEGIWQALITTAFGLIIALPALLFFRWFQSLVESRLRTLNDIANSALAVVESSRGVPS